MLALCLMLSGTYYAKNYAGIIGRGLLAPAVVLYHQYVIVAGGKDDHGNALDSIEVFDITKPHWMIINTHLPQPMYQISATICGDSFTIVGYDDANKKCSSEAYTIPVEGILSHSPSSTAKDNTKWHQLADHTGKQL